MNTPPKNNTNDPTDAAWLYREDICTPPVEEDEDEDTKEQEDEQVKAPRVKKVKTEDTSAPPSSRGKHSHEEQKASQPSPSTPATPPPRNKAAEPSRQQRDENNIRINSPLRPVEYVTERPPVHLNRQQQRGTNTPPPPTTNNNGTPSTIPKSATTLFSELSDMTIPNVSTSDLHDLIALSIRREQACPGAGLHLFLSTILHWTDTTLTADSLPGWFTALLQHLPQDESRRILLSYVVVSKEEASCSASSVFSTEAVLTKVAHCRDTWMHGHYEGACLELVELVMALTFALMVAALFAVLARIRDSLFRSSNTFNCTECDEEY